jgi:hypothetical protein
MQPEMQVADTRLAVKIVNQQLTALFKQIGAVHDGVSSILNDKS